MSGRGSKEQARALGWSAIYRGRVEMRCLEGEPREGDGGEGGRGWKGDDDEATHECSH